MNFFSLLNGFFCHFWMWLQNMHLLISFVLKRSLSSTFQILLYFLNFRVHSNFVILKIKISRKMICQSCQSLETLCSRIIMIINEIKTDCQIYAESVAERGGRGWLENRGLPIFSKVGYHVHQCPS